MNKKALSEGLILVKNIFYLARKRTILKKFVEFQSADEILEISAQKARHEGAAS